MEGLIRTLHRYGRTFLHMVLNIRVILLRFDECHHSVFPDGEIDDCEDIYSHEGKYYDPNGYISHLGEGRLL